MYILLFKICNSSPVGFHAISIDDRPTRTTSIIDYVYLEMMDLGRERCALRSLCAMSKISKLNRQISMHRGSLESQELMLLEYGANSHLAKSKGRVFCITQPYMCIHMLDLYHITCTYIQIISMVSTFYLDVILAMDMPV
jgi:hypothetical protein